jgi:hypothetical protein
MVDIETLGTKPGSVILSIGAVRFDESGVGTERFYRPIDVLDGLMHGLTVDQATVGWWRMQSAEARGALQPGRPLRETLEHFRTFVSVPGPYTKPAEYFWAKGPDFDLTLLAAAYDAVGVKVPWSYRNSRDVRTILALAPGAAEQCGRQEHPAHHALGDAELQAWQVIESAKQLGFPLSEMA